MRKKIAQMLDAIKKRPFRQDFLTAGKFIKDNAIRAGQIAFDRFDRSFQGIQDFFNRFDTIMREGNYHSNRTSTLVQLLRPKKEALPETVSAVAATRMMDTTFNVGRRMFWLTVFTILTTKSVIWAGLLLGAAGVGIIGYEYRQAKKSREDLIRELNFAGQTVEGKRADLCRLHDAQMRIMNLADNFKRASLESTTDTINTIVAGVNGESKRIKVIAPGRYGASADHYEFSEPCIKLVNDDHMTPISSIPNADQEILTLKKAWAENASNDNKLEERVRELEETIETLRKAVGDKPGGPGPQ